MKIRLAYVREQGIDFVVFFADALSKSRSAREALLANLTTVARRAGMKVDKSALAYRHGSRPKFFGTSDLVRFLARAGAPDSTHTLDV